MDFEVQEAAVRALIERLLCAADQHEWRDVGDLHSELQRLLLHLFQQPDLPRDMRPAKLLREVQLLSEDLSRRASHARRKCGEHLSHLRHQRRGIRLYQDTVRSC